MEIFGNEGSNLFAIGWPMQVADSAMHGIAGLSWWCSSFTHKVKGIYLSRYLLLLLMSGTVINIRIAG